MISRHWNIKATTSGDIMYQNERIRWHQLEMHADDFMRFVIWHPALKDATDATTPKVTLQVIPQVTSKEPPTPQVTPQVTTQLTSKEPPTPQVISM